MYWQCWATHKTTNERLEEQFDTEAEAVNWMISFDNSWDTHHFPVNY